MQILLKDIVLEGFHGVHDYERKIGTNFKIDITIEMKESVIKELDDTIDYVKVYNILKEEFKKTEHLLEVLADRILNKIASLFQNIIQIDITIFKLNPPIQSFEGKVGVRKTKIIN